ncbi:Flavin-containing monooxygenase [Heracleum sosnowskyi]|uniref:Flavin-containing monooxygenase n=1 Tax=Heracleum sosnowskyi TaxID=360622 RepID=A0AAD8HV48_9APIA|nr:Flavin-containing monooxygenase [Heracleum sosnowskyi]
MQFNFYSKSSNKYCKSKCFDPIVFESETSVGGVWRKIISTTRLQTPKQYYQFSDFPWPPSVKDEFPPQGQVFQYLESYANHFDLLQHIRFGCQVVSISYNGPSDEEMRACTRFTFTALTDASTQVYQVSFVILCFGKFSSLPNIPEFPKGKGPEVFHGKVIHSADYAAMDHTDAANLIKDKRVEGFRNQL